MSAGALAGLVPSINKGETNDPLQLDLKALRCSRLRKNLGVAAKWLSRCAGQPWMLTLTYRGVDDWEPCHIKATLQHLRKWLQRAHGWTLRYIWVMELQKRGAPHYHVVVWLPRQIEKTDLFLDFRGWWPHGMTNAVKAVAPVRYVMKYVSKFDSETPFPKGARIYGVGGLDLVGSRCRRWINWPSAVQDRASINCDWVRARGGGWLDRGSGELLRSEWALTLRTKAAVVLTRVVEYTRTLNPVGPFSWIGADARGAPVCAS
jgi:hypothetical protein